MVVPSINPIQPGKPSSCITWPISSLRPSSGHLIHSGARDNSAVMTLFVYKVTDPAPKPKSHATSSALILFP